MKRTLFASAAILALLASAIYAFADIARPKPSPAEPKSIFYTGLTITSDSKAFEARLQISENTLKRLQEAAGRNGGETSLSQRVIHSSGRTMMAGLFMFLAISFAGVWFARSLLKCEITDPVSGFFMVRREVAEEAGASLSGVGTKILIDLLSSSPRALSVTELPYRFRGRYSGSSKHDWLTVLEYLALLAEKITGRYLPSKFFLFGLVGASGMVVHLVVLRVLLAAVGTGFVGAQSVATAIAMVWNYFLNNALTYRECRLVGWAALRGLISFMAICALGAVVNVLVARDLYAMTQMWLLAGAGGAAVGALLNYALTSMFTWRWRLS